MKCGTCGFESPPGARFCGRCGLAFGGHCPACGTLHAPGLVYCTACGAPLEPAPEAPAAGGEERRVVTVLFADLVSFTSRAEQLDPEDVRSFLLDFHARLRSELERYGGTVEKFIGDAVMAVFGAPVAHDDDPERAVRAALAIRDATAGEDGVKVRIGVTTGEALVAVGARPGEGETMVVGDVVNTAARLQTMAPVDGVLVDETTYRATRQAVEYVEVSALRVKGKVEEVSAWRAVRERSSMGVDLPAVAASELVGRREELALLVGAFERARRERVVQLVTLIGGPGIGKTRLVLELLKVVDADPEFVLWRQGRCLPYGDGVTFWAVGEMVKGHAGILESDDVATATTKLRAVVQAAVPDEVEARRLERHLRPLVGLAPDEPSHEQRREEAFAAWRSFFEALARQRPLVLAFEDLHWADEGMLGFVDHLVEWSEPVPLLVVCTARPELLERHPAWAGGKRNAVTVSLPPLSGEETNGLLAQLLGQALPASAFRDALLDRVGGNPLYAEEYVRMLDDRGLLRVEDGTFWLEAPEQLPLPETLQGILAARLDALSPEERDLLENAAVVGKVFWPGALAAVGGVDRERLRGPLHALERRDLVRQAHRSSVAGEAEYAFGHMLVRDAAYGRLPRRRRAEGHRRAAEWMEALAADRSEDKAEMLAHHYLAALEYAQAAGEPDGDLVERARHALREAGWRADLLGSPAVAARFYRSALELWPEGDPERPELLLACGKALTFSEVAGDDELAEARDAFLERGDLARAAEAEARLGALVWDRGDGDPGDRHLRLALSYAGQVPASPEKGYVLARAAGALMTTSQPHEAIRVGEEALRIAEELDDVELRCDVLTTVASARSLLGDHGGVADLERCIDMARAAGLPRHEARGCINLASMLVGYGTLQPVAQLYEDGARAAARGGYVWWARFIQAEKAGIAYLGGRWDEAQTLCDRFIAESESAPHLMEAQCRIVRGAIRLGRRGAEAGSTDLRRAVELARRETGPMLLYPALAYAGWLLPGDDRTGAQLAAELLALWRGTDCLEPPGLWVVPLAFALTDSPDLARALEQAPVSTRWLEAARAIAAFDFAAAADLLAEIGSVTDEAYARLRAAEATGDEGQLQRALAFYKGVHATALVRRAEAILVPSA